jgi:abhydrolase domain-containing protein 17
VHAGYICKPSFDNEQFDPYEPYNEHVFEANEENILDDSEYIFDYLNQVLGIDQEDMIIFGRSMGSGPATHVASVRDPGCLLLMSSFKSIRAIAEY